MKILYLFILQILYINSQDCESQTNINTRYDCLSLSDSNNFCCYNGTTCTLVNIKDFLTNKETPGVDYNTIDCGVINKDYKSYEFKDYHPRSSKKINLDLESCGVYEPSKRKHCSDYSELTNSCCLFTEKGTTNKACYYIGQRYTGKLEKKNYNYNGKEIEYECLGVFLKRELLLIIVGILFLM